MAPSAASLGGIERFLTPTKKTRLATWCANPCRKTHFLLQAYQTGLILCGDRRILPQEVAHQQRV
jgi:hypothetical protein